MLVEHQGRGLACPPPAGLVAALPPPGILLQEGVSVVAQYSCPDSEPCSGVVVCAAGPAPTPLGLSLSRPALALRHSPVTSSAPTLCNVGCCLTHCPAGSCWQLHPGGLASPGPVARQNMRGERRSLQAACPGLPCCKGRGGGGSWAPRHQQDCWVGGSWGLWVGGDQQLGGCGVGW